MSVFVEIVFKLFYAILKKMYYPGFPFFFFYTNTTFITNEKKEGNKIN